MIQQRPHYTPVRAYDKTWEDIELMLERAEKKRREWRSWYDVCKKDDDKEGMKEAARNYKALEGVVKTLEWVLGQDGIEDPLQ
ncbi:MAG: hypothetical protein VW230_02545 [Candidatus Poseidoniales archaeon]